MIVVRPIEPSDLERVHALRAQSFRGTSAQRDAPDMTPENYRVAERDGALVGCLRIHRFGHFWGGRAIPAAGIASVAVAAEARGKGVGAALMRETLGELRAGGTLISSLYPATAPLYKACGYGFGGVRTNWKATLERLPRSSTLSVEPFDEGALGELDACYARIAAGSNGLVRRNHDWWIRRVLTSWNSAPSYHYLVREHGRVTGWIVYRVEESKDSWRFTLMCRDLFWETAEAARALLAMASMHRSTGHEMQWTGPATEPLADLMPEDVVEHDDAFRFMVRLVDVPGALEARGYPAGTETQVTIAVRDAFFAQNEGPWNVRVEGGSAKVAPADGPAQASAGVRTWATIWSGLYGARDAVRLGELEATPEAIEALEAIFAGPIPWIADFY